MAAPDRLDVSATPSPGASPGAPFPGWRVVAGCFIVLAVGSGLGFYGLAVYLNSFSKEQDWPLSTISLATTVFFVVSGLFGLVVARMIARIDARIVIVVGAVVGGVSLAALGQVTEQWQLFVVYSVFGVGFAAAGMIPVTTVVTRWFHVRRAVALSIASTGLSVGGIVFTPVAKWLIDDRGLASSTPILGAIFILGTVPPAWLLVRPDPEADGWFPDGEPREAGAPSRELSGATFHEALHSRFFWAVTIGYIFALGSQVGGLQQLVKLVEERTDERTAQFAITVVATTSVVARLIGGRLVEVVPMMRFTVLLTLVQCVSLLALGIAESTVVLFAFIVVFGMTIGNILMLQPLLIAERFGVREYAQIFSRSQLVSLAGTAGGPLLLGWLYDVAGSYRMPYAVAATCSLLGAIILATGGPATVPGDE